MECPRCGGKGEYMREFGGYRPCEYCNGTGEVWQTNEEWLRTATTEQLAETILEMCEYRPCFACGIGYCDDENWCHVYSDEAKEFVIGWLKQPHTEKE